MLGQFCQQWCLQMGRLQDKAQRESTSRALCLMGKANPSAVNDHLRSFCSTASLWGHSISELPEDLKDMFKDIFHSYQATKRERNELIL